MVESEEAASELRDRLILIRAHGLVGNTMLACTGRLHLGVTVVERFERRFKNDLIAASRYPFFL
jgi:translation elongation factor EF-G